MLDLIANELGPRAEEASRACANLKFKDVSLINNVKISKINSGQFLRSLENNMRYRLFTFQASNTGTSGNTFKNQYEELFKDIKKFDPKSWSDNCDIQFRDNNVKD